MDINCARSHDKKYVTYETQTASVDRVDNTKGYVTTNIQWVHKDINYMKQEYPQDYFKQLCKLVTEHNV